MTDQKQVLDILRKMAAKMEEQKEYLTELDRPIGDNDHGINMAKSQTEAKRAVEAGYWPLYRYNPAEEKPFKWETKEATASFQEFIRSENRYKSLFKTAPADAEALLAKAETDAHRRMTFYKNLGEMMK